MSEYIKVAVDAMGGDYAPQEPVKGVVEALQEKPELYVYLVGQVDVLKKELDKLILGEVKQAFNVGSLAALILVCAGIYIVNCKENKRE